VSARVASACTLTNGILYQKDVNVSMPDRASMFLVLESSERLASKCTQLVMENAKHTRDTLPTLSSLQMAMSREERLKMVESWYDGATDEPRTTKSPVSLAATNHHSSSPSSRESPATALQSITTARAASKTSAQSAVLADVTSLIRNHSCAHALLDVYSHHGVLSRVLYEPHRFADSLALSDLKAVFGLDPECAKVCAISFEPDPADHDSMIQVQSRLRQGGAAVLFLPVRVGVSHGQLHTAFKRRQGPTQTKMVHVVDLAQVIKTVKRALPPSATLAMKLDVEFGEFSIIPHLVLQQALCLVDHLFADSISVRAAAEAAVEGESPPPPPPAAIERNLSAKSKQKVQANGQRWGKKRGGAANSQEESRAHLEALSAMAKAIKVGALQARYKTCRTKFHTLRSMRATLQGTDKNEADPPWTEGPLCIEKPPPPPPSPPPPPPPPSPPDQTGKTVHAT